jgi:hypothetical protein
MEAAVFFRLVFRLPAYEGVLAARVAAEGKGGSSGGRHGGRTTYESSSAQAGHASTASTAAPATSATLGALNAQLGGQFFSVAKVPAGAVN